MSASGPQALGRIWISHVDGAAVLHLRGEIDTAAVAAFDAEVDVAGGGVPAVQFVDTAGVTFLNSVGVRLLLRVTAEANAAGRRPLLRSATPVVLRVLTLTGLLRSFEVLEPTGAPTDDGQPR